MKTPNLFVRNLVEIQRIFVQFSQLDGVGGLVGSVLATNARGPGSSLASAQWEGIRFSDGQWDWTVNIYPL